MHLSFTFCLNLIRCKVDYYVILYDVNDKNIFSLTFKSSGSLSKTHDCPAMLKCTTKPILFFSSINSGRRSKFLKMTVILNRIKKKNYIYIEKIINKSKI